MAVKKTFNFKLGDRVRMGKTESGEVVGRAQFTDANPSYLVRYVAGTGNLTEQWWNESALLGE